MKEPKYVKYEEDSKDNQGKRYNFFEEGLFPEKEDEKKLKNKSSQKKQQKYPFSIAEQENKRISNTQKEDLLPFFAKNYPSSSESKEDICFINTPAPSNSNTYSGGEAEEVEGIEEEDEKNDKSEEKKINNEDYELSVDFNSEIEAEQERPSKTMTREEILSRIEEKKKRDEDEKRKKEEERKKKEEEEKKRKELEEKEKKEREEKMLREQEIKRQKMIEEEKRRQKEEEEKRKKENEEKRKRELSKKKREERKREEQEKKLQEEKKKNNASGNKADKFNLLSSIKKNSNDNSYIASNSIINEVKQIFPETIPEENDGEDDDFSRKNFRGSSKKKISNKNSKKENKISDSKKSKKVSNFNDNLNKYKNNKRSQAIKKEDNEEDEDEDKDENSKKKDKSKKRKTKSKKSISSKVSQKSNGLGKQYNGREVIKKISEEDNVSELSNYGDELIDAEDNIKIKEEKEDKEDKEEKEDREEKEEYDSDTEPKKKKVRKNDKKKSNPKKRKNSKQKRSSKIKSEYTDREIEIARYNALDKAKINTFIPQEPEEKTFGNGRYSLRKRFPTLNHLVGENAKYTYFDGIPTLTEVNLVNRRAFSVDAILREETKKKKKKKKLVKSINLDDKLDDISEENEYNSQLLESQNVSEYGDDDERFLKIPRGGKKSEAKNYSTLMIIKIHDAQGKNMIRVDNKKYIDLKTGDEVRVNKDQIYEILNFSENHLIVQLLLDYED